MTSSMNNRYLSSPKLLRGRCSLCNMDVEFDSELGEIEEGATVRHARGLSSCIYMNQ